jgi:hypothetical protein
MSQEFADFEIHTDFNEIPAMSGEFTLLPPGEYELDVRYVKQDTSKSTNNPMIVVTYEVAGVLSAPGIENPDSLIGQKAWANYSLLPQSLGRLKQLMVAAGANLDKFRAAEIMDARILATIVHNQGDARVDSNGTPLPARTFANVQNERPLEVAAPATKSKTVAAAPPITNIKPGKAPPNGAARRG